MANWATIKQLSDKMGIAESVLQQWAKQDFITHSTIGKIMMIDEESLNNFLDVHKNQLLSDESISRLLKKREQEREAMISQLDNDIFVLKALDVYHPLAKILMQELCKLINDEFYRGILLAISMGEPIEEIGEYYQLNRQQIKDAYDSAFDDLKKDKMRIGLYRNMLTKSLLEKYMAVPPSETPLTNTFLDHIRSLLLKNWGFTSEEEFLDSIFNHHVFELKN